MILKLKQNNTWRFIDNIQEVITPTTKKIIDLTNDTNSEFQKKIYITQYDYNCLSEEDKLSPKYIYEISENRSNEDEGVFIQYWKNGEFLNQNVAEGCYILNDNGKTIEKIC